MSKRVNLQLAALIPLLLSGFVSTPVIGAEPLQTDRNGRLVKTPEKNNTAPRKAPAAPNDPAPTLESAAKRMAESSKKQHADQMQTISNLK